MAAVPWKVADSLEALRRQLNALAPRRSTASDGSIGDAAHASRSSDHNPWWSFAGQPYVTARDFTHDPAGGLDCGWLAGILAQRRDPRVKYVIWNRSIMSGAGGPSPWAWRAYSGANPHTHHLHLSVVADARALSAIPWQLEPPTGAHPLPGRPASEEDDVELTDPIPDYYAQGRPPLSLRDTLAWGTAHAAHARDWAAEAANRVAAVDDRLERVEAMVHGMSERVSAGQGAPAAAPKIDYDQLAAALLRGIAKG